MKMLNFGFSVILHFSLFQDLVLYYFSAHWCPPCRQFTPMLKDFYEVQSLDQPILLRDFVAGHRTISSSSSNFHQEAEGIEIVFVSSDRSAEDMTSYMKVRRLIMIPKMELHLGLQVVKSS